MVQQAQLLIKGDNVKIWANAVILKEGRANVTIVGIPRKCCRK